MHRRISRAPSDVAAGKRKRVRGRKPDLGADPPEPPKKKPSKNPAKQKTPVLKKPAAKHHKVPSEGHCKHQQQQLKQQQ